MWCDFSIGEESTINGSFCREGSTTEHYSVSLRVVRSRNDASLIKGNQPASPAKLPMEHRRVHVCMWARLRISKAQNFEYPVCNRWPFRKSKKSPTHIPSQPRSDVTPPTDYYRNLRPRMRLPLVQTATVESTISIAGGKGLYPRSTAGWINLTWSQILDPSCGGTCVVQIPADGVFWVPAIWPAGRQTSTDAVPKLNDFPSVTSVLGRVQDTRRYYQLRASY